MVQNGEITLTDCRVPDANRLQGGSNSFRDTARVLRQTRYLVGWESTGCAMGAYEHALKYAQDRLQFGKPIGSFQLVQDLLARMLANITACQCLVARTAQLDIEGKLTDARRRSPRRSAPKSRGRSRGPARFSAAASSPTITWPFLLRRRSPVLHRHLPDAEPDRW